MIRRVPTALPTALATLPRTEALARTLVLRTLERWRHGHLTLRLPDGRTRTFGDARASEHAAITVADDAFFARVLAQGELGTGEAYQDGLWRADDLVLFVRLFLRNMEELAIDGPLARAGQLVSLIAHRLRRNSRRGSAANIHAHYDLGNDFYRLFLDESMTYSCAVFGDGDDLATAQRRKLDLVCDALRLAPGDEVLEIGCGWGSFALHAARERGCRVTAVTISQAQHALAAERVAAAGLGDRVDVQRRDYRDLPARAFDKIASIEMFEAVGREYWPAYFAAAARALRPGGRMLLQTIAMPDARFDAYRRNVDWTQKHIFPGSCIPGLAAMTAAAAHASDLVVEEVRDIGPSYAPTLRAWRERFLGRLDDVRALGFDERFIRTWELYLAFSEAAFAERTLQDYQLLLRSSRAS